MEKNRTYNSTKNMTFGFANKMVSMVLSFVGRAIFTQILAKEYLGITGLFGDVLVMLSLADLGLTTAMAYSFYRPLAEKDYKKISALIGFYRKMYLCIAAVVAVVGVAIVPFLDFFVKSKNPIPHLEVYYLICLADTVVSYLFVYKSSIITADQKASEISKYGMWINVLKLVGQSVILYITHNFICYLSVRIFTTLANNLVISYKANKMYPYIKEKVELEPHEKLTIFNNVKSVFLYKVSSVLLNGTDNIIISKIVGTVFVGLYANYNMIVVNLSSMAGIIFSSLTASLGNLIIKEKAEKRYEIFKVMQMVSFWLSGVFVVCMYFVTEEFVKLWVGKDYLLNHMALIVIVLNFYLAISLQPIWTFREATGLYMKTKYIMVITAVINIICSIVLGSLFGVAGIIAATFIAKITTYFWYEPYILYHDFFERKVFTYYFDHIKNLLTVLTAGVLSAYIVPNISANSYPLWIVKAGLYFIIVNAVYLLVNFRTKEFQMIMGKLKKALKPA